MPTMHQNAFGCRAPPGRSGGARALPKPSSRYGGLLLRKRVETREDRGKESGGREKGRKKGGDESSEERSAL